LNAVVASVEDVLRQTTAFLAGGGIAAPRHEARILLGHVMGLTREELLLVHRRQMEEPEIDNLIRLAQRRAAHEPIAYLTGEREFWGLAFEVTRDTLIPRPDSETLIEAALRFARRMPGARPRILDFGVGSGCLLISLLTELPAAEGFGVDRNIAALTVARRNAARHEVSSRACFAAGSWGDAVAPSFDLIIANPPYVAVGERAGMMADVRDYEPAEALFAGADGDEAYRALAPELHRLLTPAGRAFVELGAGMGDRVAAIFGAAELTECARHSDLAGTPRCGIFARSGA